MKPGKIFPWLYLALGLAQTAHSIEEVLAGLWLNLPEISAALHMRVAIIQRQEWYAQVFAAANLAIVALLMSLSPFVFLGRSWAARMARVVAVIETLNGLGHLTAALVTRAYFPGCISAVFLLAFSIPLWASPKLRRFPNGID